MGYYASTAWSVKFRDQQAMDACKQELTDELSWTWDNEAEPWLSNIGEFADEWRDDSEIVDPLEIVGSTSGKYSWDSNKAIGIIAKYATGTVDLDASDSGDGHYRYVLKDGKVESLIGSVKFYGEREKEIDGLLEAFIDAHKAYTEADEDGGDDTDDAWERVQQIAVKIAHALAAQKKEN